MNTKPISASQSVKETNNMKKLKTFLCSALAVVSLLTLTACGDAKTPEKQPAADQLTSEPTVAVQDETLPSGMTEIDAFADFEYRMDGISPCVYISLYGQKVNGVSVNYKIQNEKDMYKNGDIFTVKATIQDDMGKYVLKEETKDFVVNVESHYIETAEELTEESMTILHNAANAALDEYIDYWEKSGDFEFDGYTPIGHELWFTQYPMGTPSINYLVFYYQINATDKDGNDASSFTYIMFYNMIQHGDGKQELNATSYNMPHMSDYKPMYPTMTDITATFEERYGDIYNIESYFVN